MRERNWTDLASVSRRIKNAQVNHVHFLYVYLGNDVLRRRTREKAGYLSECRRFELARELTIINSSDSFSCCGCFVETNLYACSRALCRVCSEFYVFPQSLCAFDCIIIVLVSHLTVFESTNLRNILVKQDAERLLNQYIAPEEYTN